MPGGRPLIPRAVRLAPRSVPRSLPPKPTTTTPPAPKPLAPLLPPDPIAKLPVKNPAPLASDAAQQKQQAFRQRRYNLQRSLELQVNAGTISRFDMHRQLQRAGFVPGGPGVYKKPPGWMVPELQTIGDFAQMAHDTPLGIVESSKAMGADLRDYASNSKATPFPRTRKLGGSVVSSLKTDFEHPLRHPGYTIADLAVGVGGAVKVAGKLGEAGRAVSGYARAAPAGTSAAGVAGKVGRDVGERLLYGRRGKGAPRRTNAEKALRMQAAYAKMIKQGARRVVPVSKTPYGNLVLTRLEANRARNERLQRTLAASARRPVMTRK